MSAPSTETTTATRPLWRCFTVRTGDDRWAARILLVALVALTIYLNSTQGAYNLFLYNTFLLAAIGATGLNLTMGTAGLVSVGSAAFLCSGAFVSVLAEKAGLDFPLAVLAAALVSGLLGGLFALPSARLAALYFALSTLAAQAIVVYVAQEYQRHQVGDSSFIVLPIFSSRGIHGLQESWAWLLTISLSLTVIGVARLRRGRAGRAWRLLRDHELAAATVGIQVARWKVLAMMVSSALIGVEGSFNYFFTGGTSTSQYTLLLSIEYIAMLLIGGMDSVLGPVIGAAIVILLPTITKSGVSAAFGSSFATTHGTDVSRIIYGILVMAAIVLARNGISGLLRQGVGYVRRLTGPGAPSDPDTVVLTGALAE